jgi:hypothetical protein
MRTWRVRQLLIALVLFLLFFALVGLNIKMGSVKMPLGQALIPNTIEHDILWKVRLPRLTAATVLGGALALSGFFAPDFLWQSHRGAICVGHFCRGEVDCGLGYGICPGPGLCCQFKTDGFRSLCRGHAFNGLCASGGAAGQSRLVTHYQWRDDWIYLLGHY